MKYKLLIGILLLGLVACAPESPRQEQVALGKISVTPVEPVKKMVESPLYVSRDYGATWDAVEEGLPTDAQVSFLAQTENEVILTTDNAGIFVKQKRTTDWRQIGEGLPNKKINALHTEGEDLFVGVYQSGIYKRNKADDSWVSLIYNLPDLRVQTITSIEGELLVGTDTGIFKLSKADQRWKKVFSDVQSVTLNKYKNKIVSGTNKGTLLSEDQGMTWKWINKKGAVHNSTIVNGRIVLMNISDAFYFSDNWGETWEESMYFPKKGSYIYEVTQLDRYWVMSNNYGVHRSVDGGNTWFLTFSTPELRFFDFLLMGNVIYAGTRGTDGC